VEIFIYNSEKLAKHERDFFPSFFLPFSSHQNEKIKRTGSEEKIND
jgi:hypothetical protein